MSRPILLVVPACTVVLIILGGRGVAQEPKNGPRPAEPTLTCRLVDDSTVKVALLEAQVEFVTEYGKLTIPVKDIRKVDLGLRIPEDVASQIAAAAAELGSTEFRKREAAMALLLKHREKSYPTLKVAARSADAEVSRRAEELIEKLKGILPEERLDLPDHDLLHTDASRIAGRIVSPALKARSFTFGELELKLSDVLTMSVDGLKEPDEVAGVLPDPGGMGGFQAPQHIGKTYVFRVTGAAGGSLWGTEMYTLDSSLASAAVHMGVLKLGQTGNVKVTILGPSVGFVGSNRNGIVSSSYASYPGAFRVHPK